MSKLPTLAFLGSDVYDDADVSIEGRCKLMVQVAIESGSRIDEEYMSISDYLERMDPAAPSTEDLSADVERADELIITANTQGW